jgi:ArsR family transcriptional regulator
MARAKIEKFDGRLVALAGIAKALGHPARIEILRYLGKRGEVPCMEIVDHLPLSQPASSRHIHELLRAGLLESRSDGARVFYRIHRKAPAEFCVALAKALKGTS